MSTVRTANRKDQPWASIGHHSWRRPAGLLVSCWLLWPLSLWKDQRFVPKRVDNCSELVFAFPLHRGSASTTVWIFIEWWTHWHGISHSIASDQVTNVTEKKVFAYLQYTLFLPEPQSGFKGKTKGTAENLTSYCQRGERKIFLVVILSKIPTGPISLIILIEQKLNLQGKEQEQLSPFLLGEKNRG